MLQNMRPILSPEIVVLIYSAPVIGPVVKQVVRSMRQQQPQKAIFSAMC